MNNTYLAHHGIKGMRWGIRRYQNKNGTLTAAGKKRANMSDDAKEADVIRKKKVSSMSNAELKKVSERLRLEQEYAKLNTSSYAIKRGLGYAATALGVLGTVTAVYKGGNTMVTAGKEFVKNL